MSSLPFLIGKFSIGNCKKAMIILCRQLVFSQMIVSGGTKEIADRYLGKQLGSIIERFDGQHIVVIFAGDNRQISVGRAQIALQSDGGYQLVLGFGELALFHKSLSQREMQFSLVRFSGNE